MIIVMKGTATEENLQDVIHTVEELGYQSHVIRGTQRSVVGAVGDERGKARLRSLEAMEGVGKVVPLLPPLKLASREFKPTPTVVRVRNVEIGGDRLPVVAGPC